MSAPLKELSIAVVTGEHAYDVIGFQDLFARFPGIKAYIQSLDDFAASEDAVRAGYDCVVFYNFHQEIPDDDNCTWFMGKRRSVLDSLALNDQGIVFLHHGLLAFPDWSAWSDLISIHQRSFTYSPDELVNLIPTAVEHPITTGLGAWTITDEIYGMQEPHEVQVLLTTDHPRSMKSIAWIKESGKKRIFCFASGHDNQAWANSGFQKVLLRGIRWASGGLG